jgi:asparagine synthase (glutamine-hydrolysing)
MYFLGRKSIFNNISLAQHPDFLRSRQFYIKTKHMCGISGVIAFDRRLVAESIQAMNHAQSHRGPDDEGVWVQEGGHLMTDNGAEVIGLGHRRLSIIDISSAGHQPMTDTETGNWITFNGEIYNFRELRRSLESSGCSFRTGTDTEVILKAYGVWGLGCVERLRGIFAFGLWDAGRKRLLLARDQLGVKPLYIWQKDGMLVFASEVRAVLSSGFMPAQLDMDGLASYMAYGSVQEPFTLISGIRSLPAGYWMEWQTGVTRTQRYWRIPSPEGAALAEPEDMYACLFARLEDAVKCQLVSDVPTGAFLSGGIDSTAIAALMKKNAGSNVRTFSVVFPESAYDERKFSRLAARYMGTQHTEVELTGDRVIRCMDQAMNAFDQPSLDGLNTWFVSQAAREAGLTVALSGLGGDELFAGYEGFHKPLLAERYGRIIQAAPLWMRNLLSLPLLRLGTSEAVRKLGELLTTPRHPYFVTRRFFNEFQIRRLLCKDAMRSSNWETEALMPLEDEAAGYDPISRASAFELQTYMRSTLLRDTDQMSMSHALEVRVPLIDHKLVELIFSLPGRCRIVAGQPKSLLTLPLQDMLPDECVHRRKMGFELPFKEWFAGSLHARMQDAFCAETSEESTWPFDPSALKMLWRQFQEGRVNWSRVWGVFVLLRWLKRYGVKG